MQTIGHQIDIIIIPLSIRAVDYSVDEVTRLCAGTKIFFFLEKKKKKEKSGPLFSIHKT